MKNWQAVIVGLVIGFLGGVGTMQATLVADNRDHNVRLRYMENRVTESEAMFEKRLDNVIRLWEASIQSNQELISLVKQALIVQQAKKGQP